MSNKLSPCHRTGNKFVYFWMVRVRKVLCFEYKILTIMDGPCNLHFPVLQTDWQSGQVKFRIYLHRLKFGCPQECIGLFMSKCYVKNWTSKYWILSVHTEIKLKWTSGLMFVRSTDFLYSIEINNGIHVFKNLRGTHLKIFIVVSPIVTHFFSLKKTTDLLYNVIL